MIHLDVIGESVSDSEKSPGARGHGKGGGQKVQAGRKGKDVHGRSPVKNQAERGQFVEGGKGAKH